MPRRYWYVMLTYVIGLFSINLGAPILILMGVPKEALTLTGIWSSISFPIMLIVTLILMRPDMERSPERNSNINIGKIILWTFIGFFIIFFAQIIAANIEIYLFGVEPESDNTAQLIEVAKITPIFIFVTAIIAPILEEIIFRKIIFGSLYKKYGSFLLAVLVSALLFGILHREPEHIIRYAAAGVAFAFLYVKTKSIIVPILTHISLNSFVFIIRYLIPPEEIERILEQYEQAQTILIGG